MSIDFNAFLSLEEKQNILVQRIKGMAADAYTISLNKQVLESAEEVNQDALASVENDLETLERAINIYRTELDSLASVVE